MSGRPFMPIVEPVITMDPPRQVGGTAAAGPHRGALGDALGDVEGYVVTAGHATPPLD
jgi:hypothetical protein